MSTINQAPVNLRISNLVNLGGYPKGYLIINKSLTATIWVASNPSVADGNGTPIYPSTSIVWNTDGTLFANLGVDTASITAGYADITLSYDTQLWQPNPIAVASATAIQVLNSGIIIVDNPVVIVNQNFNANPGNVFGAYIDVTRYNSITVGAYATSIVAPTANAILRIEWYADKLGNVLEGYDTLTWIPGGTGIRWQSQIPCRGAYVRIVVVNDADPLGRCNIFVQVIASYRVVQNLVQTIGTSLNTLMSIIGENVAAGGNSLNHYLQPYIGEIEIWATCTGNAAGSYISIAADTFGLQIPLDGTNGSYQASGLTWVVKRLALYGAQSVIVFHNAAANAVGWYCVIRPVRNNP